MDSLKQNINWLNFISNIKIKQDQKKNAPENIIHILWPRRLKQKLNGKLPPCTIPSRESTRTDTVGVLIMPDQMQAQLAGVPFLPWKKLLNHEGHVRVTIMVLKITKKFTRKKAVHCISNQPGLVHNFIKYSALGAIPCFTHRVWVPPGLEWQEALIVQHHWGLKSSS